MVVPVWPKKFAREEILRTPFTFPHGVMYTVLRRTVAPAGSVRWMATTATTPRWGRSARATKSAPPSPTPPGGSGRFAPPKYHPGHPDRLGRPERRQAPRPDGEEFDVEGIPEVPKNPFTGWTPRMHVGLTRTRFEGGDA